MIQYEELTLADVWLLTPQIHGDERGSFTEVLRYPEFSERVCTRPFVQENEAFSTRGVLRGLHLQKDADAQAKLVRCIKGAIVDVIVDLRRQSPSQSYGHYLAVRLDDQKKQQLYVPRGFAHGYLVLSEEAIVSYKVDNGYAPQSEVHIHPFDPIIGVNWSLYGIDQKDFILSERDLRGISLSDYHIKD